MSIKSPDPIDIAVGQRVRARRIAIGMSQETLADAMGLTFQQVQKYEKGTNRISASRLVKISETLHCEVPELFGCDVKRSPNNHGGDETTVLKLLADKNVRRGVLALAKLTAAEQANLAFIMERMARRA